MLNLRDKAVADTRNILEGVAGIDVALTNPAQSLTATVRGFSSDIARAIDPETNLFVQGQFASVQLPIGAITDAGFSDIPTGIMDSTSKPWVVEYQEPGQNLRKYKVRNSEPDYSLGIVICTLETYIDAS